MRSLISLSSMTQTTLGKRSTEMLSSTPVQESTRLIIKTHSAMPAINIRAFNTAISKVS